MKENPIYICYSIPLKDFLLQEGEEILVSGLNQNTYKPFWCFMRSDRLSELLIKWSEGQKDDWIYAVDLNKQTLKVLYE